MATDFAVSLRRYLTDHMAGLRGCSPNTIASYRECAARRPVVSPAQPG
jgi:integrase/recombinase XerD